MQFQMKFGNFLVWSGIILSINFYVSAAPLLFFFLFGLSFSVENVPKLVCILNFLSSSVVKGEHLPLLVFLNAEVCSSKNFFWLPQLQLSVIYHLCFLIQCTIIVSLDFSAGNWWWLQSDGADGGWVAEVAAGNLCVKGQTLSVSFVSLLSSNLKNLNTNGG